MNQTISRAGPSGLCLGWHLGVDMLPFWWKHASFSESFKTVISMLSGPLLACSKQHNPPLWPGPQLLIPGSYYFGNFFLGFILMFLVPTEGWVILSEGFSSPLSWCHWKLQLLCCVYVYVCLQMKEFLVIALGLVGRYMILATEKIIFPIGLPTTYTEYHEARKNI